MKKIFLAGPMRGVDRNVSLGWREHAKSVLSNNFKVIHAMRGRELKEAFPDAKGAVVRDKQDLLSSDIILVNDTMKDVSMIGTSMEVHLAHMHNKTIIVFGNAHKGDYWLDYHLTLRFDDMESAIDFINLMYKE